MFFNSFDFAVFLPVVFILYWLVAGNKVKLQNILLLLASYFFYACWDYRFLCLLIFSTLLDFWTGSKIHDASGIKLRKFWLWLSISVNLGFLIVFKYYNFFSASFAEAFAHVGIHTDFVTLKVILPVGISFYTFHGLSYVLDIYNRKITPERNIIEYSVFVCFFPLLVAGPIERATHLLPQVKSKRVFSYEKAVDGLRQILWGLFKKVVIADNCAEYVNAIFNFSDWHSGATLVLGAVLFSFQIYCDFSGYSDIALGAARLFGIELLRNFAFPYFSRDIAEFWRRWHISLTTWFRDYLYIPLGGSKGNLWTRIRNVFIIFLVSGFWHGANWTFLAWGALHALYFLPLQLLNKNRNHLQIVSSGKNLPSGREFFQMLSTYALVVFAWIFFRASDMRHALRYIKGMLAGLKHSASYVEAANFMLSKMGALPLLLFLFLILEWLGREQQYAISAIGVRWPAVARWSFYYLLIVAMCVFAGKGEQFIYFQF